MTVAVFTQGSTLRHVITMTSASSVGLIAMFGVDLIDMYFLSLLGQEELAAAVGFAGTLLFFMTAISIGLQIAMGALVARALGAQQREAAGRYLTNVLLFSAGVSVLLSVVTFVYLEDLLRFMGASGETLGFAMSYSRILVPITPILAVGMCAAGAVRAVGDARRSMYATVGGSIVNAVLDPIFIFGFNWGIEGAAAASAAARCALFLIAFHAIFKVHDLPRATTWLKLRADFSAIMQIAGPAMLTNLATPIGGTFVLKTMAQYGDSAVAGAAILGRIAPVAFGFIFALSGAVGPIIGQNAGAGLYHRVRQTLLDALLCNAVYVLFIWLLMWLATDLIVSIFSATGDAETLIRFYATFLVGAFGFNGMLFVANASFNNLHRAHLATIFNFARALLGTIPCVYFGAKWYGAPGVMAGEALGAVLFGSLAFVVVVLQVRQLDRDHALAEPEEYCDDSDVWQYSSPHTQLGSQVRKSR